MKQMLFNEGNHLEIESVKFTEEEMNKISDCGEELFKEASRKLTSASLGELKQYWDANAKSSKRMAEVLSAFCPKDIAADAEGYIAVKDALTKALIVEAAIKKISSIVISEEKKESLDRMPGETAEEHKARLRAYLKEN